MRLEGWGPEEQAPHPPGDVPEPTGGGGYSSREGGRSGRDGRKGKVMAGVEQTRVKGCQGK